MSDYQASLYAKEGAHKFFRPQSVPIAIMDAVGKELDRLETGVVEKVPHSDWAAPIVKIGNIKSVVITRSQSTLL